MARRPQTTTHASRNLAAGARVYAYCRDSGGSGQEKSVANQRAELAAYAAQRGWVVVAWYVDEARQSGDLARRDAFMALIADCQTTPRPVDAVLIWSMSRLFRDEIDAAYFKSDLRRRGIEIISATEPIPEGPFAFIYEAFLDTANRITLDKMAVDVKRGLRANVLQGYAPGGTPPVGYRAERVTIGVKRDGNPRVVSRWVLDDTRAPLVRQAFELFAAGRSYAELDAATHLYGSVGSYKSMVRNRSYVGVLKLGDEEHPGLPAIIDEALWQRCQARLSAERRIVARPDSEYLLTGLVVCGHCGSAMTGGVDHRNETRGGVGWRFYRCNAKMRRNDACPGRARVSAERLDSKVVDVVMRQVLTERNLALVVAELERRLSSTAQEQDIAVARAAVTRTQRSIDNLLDQMADGVTESRAARDKLATLEAQLADWEARVIDLAVRAPVKVDTARIAEIVQTMRMDVESGEIGKMRRALKVFVERVEVRGEELRLTYRSSALLDISAVPPKDSYQISSSLLDTCQECGATYRRRGEQARCSCCRERDYQHDYYQRRTKRAA